MPVSFSRIVCTTDFSECSYKAIPLGLALAQEYHARLLLCHVIDLPVAAMYGEAFVNPHEVQVRVEKYAGEQLSRKIGESPVDWESVITIGHPAQEIVRITQERDVDLVIAATHGRAGLQRLVLGSVTGRLLRTLPCPALIVNDNVSFKYPGDRFHRILIGCDFSPDSNLACEYGLDLARHFDAELHLVHVMDPSLLKDAHKPDQDAESGDQPKMPERFKRKLADLIPDEMRRERTTQTMLLAGRPYEELTKYALIHQVDLMVLGVRGHSLVETLFVGSTTDRVVQMGPCPVLCIRSSDPAAMLESNSSEKSS